MNLRVTGLFSLVIAMKYSAIVLLFFIVGVETSHAAEFKLVPSLGISEEYNDNVFDSAFDVRTDYITHVLPGLVLLYKTAFWDWDISYFLDYRHYARNTYTDDYPSNLNAKGLITLVDNLLYLDLKDVYQRVSTNIRQDFVEESLNTNQTDSNIATASPYFTLQPASTVKTKIGARFSNFWYKDPNSIDKTEYSGFATLDYEIAPKIFVNTGYTFTHSEARQDPNFNNYDLHNIFVGPRYEYAEKSFIYGHGGYTIIDYASGQSFNEPFWDVGITHHFDTYVATVETRVKYEQDPEQNLTQVTDYSGRLEKIFARGSVGLSAGYSEYEYLNNSTQSNTDALQAGIDVRYELLPKWYASLTFTATYFDEKGIGNYTRYFVNPKLTYPLPSDLRDFSVVFNYIFVAYTSPDIAENNRQVNRAMLEIRKSF
jgi:hypothetical protein